MEDNHPCPVSHHNSNNSSTRLRTMVVTRPVQDIQGHVKSNNTRIKEVHSNPGYLGRGHRGHRCKVSGETNRIGIKGALDLGLAGLGLVGLGLVGLGLGLVKGDKVNSEGVHLVKGDNLDQRVAEEDHHLNSNNHHRKDNLDGMGIEAL